MASERGWLLAAGGRSCKRAALRAASGSALERTPLTEQRRNALSRTSRLSRKRDFARVFARPLRFHDRCFVVLCVPNSLAYPRIGLALSRRRVAQASQRNRIKRQVRESFRLKGHDLGGLDIVLLPQPQIARFDNPTLRASLTCHWSNLAIRCSRLSEASSAATRDS